jgi:cell division protein ZapA
LKQVEVTILGQGYLLACPEGGEARLEAAVAAVDREMTAIRDAGRIKARERIAVLAALNIAYQLAERPLLTPPGSAAPADTDGSTTAPADPAPGGPLSGEGGDWQALLARIDAALSEDGHLI